MSESVLISLITVLPGILGFILTALVWFTTKSTHKIVNSRYTKLLETLQAGRVQIAELTQELLTSRAQLEILRTATEARDIIHSAAIHLKEGTRS